MVKRPLAYPIVMLCLSVLGTLTGVSARAAGTAPGAVDVYLVPLENFPEDTAKEVAQALSAELKLAVRSAPALGPLEVETLPGTHLWNADDMIEKAQPLLGALPDRGAATHYVLLTERDIKSPAGEGRFEFSTHDPHYNTTVVSVARMRDYVEGRPVVTTHTIQRLYKMAKRNIGEQQLGWRRSPHVDDLMYTRIMTIDDLDRIGLTHRDPHEPGTPPTSPHAPTYAI